MNHITGNFLDQETQNFPLDCECLNNIQQLALLAAVCGNIGGNKIRLLGMETQGAEGVAFFRTTAHPEGEVLPVVEGTGEYLILVEDTIPVTMQGYSFPQAYNKRYLTYAESGEVGMKYTDFKPLTTTQELATQISQETTARTTAINNLQRQINEINTDVSSMFVSGMVIMWYGTLASIPAGWVLCNGSNGTPNLIDRFAVGAGGSYTKGNTYGSNSRSITLTTAHLPVHSHTITIGYGGVHSHSYNDLQPRGLTNVHENGRYSHFSHFTSSSDTRRTTSDCSSHNHTATCSNAGSGTPFTVSVLPACCALFYIMKS